MDLSGIKQDQGKFQVSKDTRYADINIKHSSSRNIPPLILVDILYTTALAPKILSVKKRGDRQESLVRNEESHQFFNFILNSTVRYFVHVVR